MQYLKQKALTPLQQLYGFKRFFADGEGYVRKGCLKWDYRMRPTPLSREYSIRIIYRLGSQPSIFVLNPSLKELAEGREIPHLYSQKKEELCVYRPRYKEWTPTQHLSKTIVPWIYSWLFYFEEWLVSNEWKGGGEHPRRKQATNRRTAKRQLAKGHKS